MTTDGGGWTLIAQGGNDNCAPNMMTQSNVVTDTDTCSFLPSSKVQSIANLSTEVFLHVNTSSAQFGAWTSSARSTNSFAIQALQTSNETWHNGAVFDNWSWSYTCTPYWNATPGATIGWPNMFQACGNDLGVHWNATPPEMNSRQHDHSGMLSIVSATYIR